MNYTLRNVGFTYFIQGYAFSVTVAILAFSPYYIHPLYGLAYNLFMTIICSATR